MIVTGLKGIAFMPADRLENDFDRDRLAYQC